MPVVISSEPFSALPTWDANRICKPDPFNSSSKLQRNVFLLEQLLQIDRPIVTEKMIKFIEQDGVYETLINFITRCDPDTPSSIEGGPLKRSFLTVLLITRPSQALRESIHSNLPIILKLLLTKAFEPGNKCNFYHLRHVVGRLLVSEGVRVLELIRNMKLLENTNLFYHISERGFINVIYSIIQFAVIKKRTECVNGILGKILELIVNQPNKTPYATDLFLMIHDILPHNSPLLKELHRDLIIKVFNMMIDPSQPYTNRCCYSTLLTRLTKYDRITKKLLSQFPKLHDAIVYDCKNGSQHNR